MITRPDLVRHEPARRLGQHVRHAVWDCHHYRLGMPDRTSACVVWRLDNDIGRHLLRLVLFSLYDDAVLFGLRRRVGIVVFWHSAVCLTYYLSHAGTTQVITPQVFLMSFSCGCVIDTLLVVNNFRDRENDLHSGKRTLITRIGAERGARLYLLAGLAGIILAALALSVSPNPVQHSIIPISFICLPYASLHVKSYLQMKMIWEGRALNEILAKTARNMLIYGLTASASFLFF